jgi:hypothetical protein
MSRWETISLRPGSIGAVGRGVTHSIRAVVTHAVRRGMEFLARFLEIRARLFAQRLRDVGNTR